MRSRHVIKWFVFVGMILEMGIAPVVSSEIASPGKIGVIAPLTGDLSQNGLTATVALEIARQDFQLAYPDTSLDFVIEDSESNPARAAEIAQKFHEQGIRIVIATGSSQEILAIKPFADAYGMIVIASTSTAPSLALEDSIIRLTPNDFAHAQGMVEYLRYLGIDGIAPIYRNDVFGNDFMAEFRSRFVERGGYVTDGVAYDTAATDLSPYTYKLSKQVEEIQQSDSSSTIAVLAVAFGEIYSIFTSASNYPILSTVDWYGTEEYARDERIDNDSIARSFALSVRFTSSINTPLADVHPYTSILPSYENLVTRALKLNSGVSETTLGVLFDSLWFAGLLLRNPSLTDVQAILKDTQEYVGYTGFFLLDENGDRTNIKYGYFQYVNVGNQPTWALVGSYKPSSYFARPALSYREFAPDANDKQVRIGLLFSLTGEYASTGKSFIRMAEIAQEDINALLQRKYTDTSKIEYVVANTESDPNVALVKIQEMKDQGIQLVVGPINSAELEKVADFANQNDMILISPSSTAVSLAKDDNIFRLTMDDRKQARALAALLIHEGYRNVEGLYRNDTYGSGLFALFDAAFSEMGGRCGVGIPYDPQTQQFDGILKTLETQVSESLKNHNAKETAILMISFDEGVAVLETAANSQSILADLQWFGGDGIAANSAVLESPVALTMAVQTKLVASTLGFGDDTEVFNRKSFLSNAAQRLAYSPTAIDVAAYDAIWLFTLLAENQDWQWDAPFEELRSDFIALANNTSGYRSINAMNEYGDCLYGSIDFYRIDSRQANQVWDVYASYWYFMHDEEGLVFFESTSDSSAREWSLYR